MYVIIICIHSSYVVYMIYSLQYIDMIHMYVQYVVFEHKDTVWLLRTYVMMNMCSSIQFNKSILHMSLLVISAQLNAVGSVRIFYEWSYSYRFMISLVYNVQLIDQSMRKTDLEDLQYEHTTGS